MDECGLRKVAVGQDIREFTSNVLAESHRIYQQEHNHPQSVYLYPPIPQKVYSVVAPIARAYYKYKLDNHLLDFDDLLLETYSAMMSPSYKDDYDMADYKWIQLDEVQDLNPLQVHQGFRKFFQGRKLHLQSC